MKSQQLPLQSPGWGGFWNCEYFPDIVYAKKDGLELKLQLIVPQSSDRLPPLVLFIQGSGWGKQNTVQALPQLSLLASRNFAVASIGFRDTSIAAFPACLNDTKDALCFLREHASDYGFDAGMVGAWGTSSGGHIASMLGLTGGLFTTEGAPEGADRVQAVVDCYGPADLLTMDDYPGVIVHNAPDSPESLLIGGALQKNRERAAEASPLHYVSFQKDIPPFLILHGTADDKVPKEQSMALAAALEEVGSDAELILVEGAGHGNDGGVIGADTMERIIGFFEKKLKKS